MQIDINNNYLGAWTVSECSCGDIMMLLSPTSCGPASLVYRILFWCSLHFCSVYRYLLTVVQYCTFTSHKPLMHLKMLSNTCYPNFSISPRTHRVTSINITFGLSNKSRSEAEWTGHSFLKSIYSLWTSCCSLDSFHWFHSLLIYRYYSLFA